MILKQDAMNALKDQPTHTLVPLPECPITASPVPWLTSIHATPGRGEYGNAGYRGNCSGLLIRDLLKFYRPRRVLDPMEGGGTCRDVCKELAIAYEGRDLKAGFDATRAESFAGLGAIRFRVATPALLADDSLQLGRPVSVECSDAGSIRDRPSVGAEELPCRARSTRKARGVDGRRQTRRAIHGAAVPNPERGRS